MQIRLRKTVLFGPRRKTKHKLIFVLAEIYTSPDFSKPRVLPSLASARR